ncbi:MAG TPA: MarR family transcriptional regulator [Nocardioides sp.]|nr:MarR family transcriptional regulator [Nocardioides sp.]
MPKDAADLHVERWRDHWVLDHPFDDQVEAMTVRVIALTRSFRAATKSAAAAVGLEDFEYATLHELMIRDTPGRASPTELAEAAKVSPAGMSGRLDTMERKGLVKRTPGRDDRRRVDVEATRKGREIWNRAMELRGRAEDDAASALTPRELATLNRLLKKMTLRLEGDGG